MLTFEECNNIKVLLSTCALIWDAMSKREDGVPVGISQLPYGNGTGGAPKRLLHPCWPCLIALRCP